MKKLIALVLSLTVLLSCFAMIHVLAATTENLVYNGDFEEGDEEGWIQYGPASDMEVDTDYAHDGEYGMLLATRGGQYATYSQDLKDALTKAGPGEYSGSMWAKLGPDAEGAADCYMVVNYCEDGGSVKYATSGHHTLTEEWQEFVFKGNIEWDQDAGLKSAIIYVQSFDEEKTAQDICVDDFVLVKESPVNGKEPEKGAPKSQDLPKVEMKNIPVNPADRPETTTVGAIRWDAWYGHDGSSGSVITQVERSLSPAEFHFRAPFFSTVTDEGKIEIPAYTQEIFDREMEYAIEAGIDYFAYCWYNTDMKKAREFHKASKYRTDVKFCALMDGNGIMQEHAHKEMAELLKDEFYMTVLGGRPLIYFFGQGGTKSNKGNIAADIEYYRRLCASLGLKEPYCVVMNLGAGEVPGMYGDAVSRYGQSLSGGVPYQELADASVEMWESWRKSVVQYVPAVSFGWHTGTRYQNPVTWTSVGSDSWVQYATDEELQASLETALTYMQKDEVRMFTVPNTVIIYAWNEHDEGGWICPTIKVDEAGNPIKAADGSIEINRGHLDAVKNAIANYKAGKLKPTATEAPTATEEPGTTTETTSFTLQWWMIAIPAAVVAVIVVAVVIAVTKSKKKESKK